MTESQEQKELIDWFKKQYPKYSKSIRLSMNGINLGGGKKAAIMINHLKSQGMVPGESDLFFAIPTKGYHGLFIEFKSTNGAHKLTDDQAEYIGYMTLLGYRAECCKGIEDAKQLISEHINLK